MKEKQEKELEIKEIEKDRQDKKEKVQAWASSINNVQYITSEILHL